MNAERLKEIREATEAATDGPWLYRPNDFDDWGCIRAPMSDESNERGGWSVAEARPGFHLSLEEANLHRSNKTDPTYHNARFIALARTAIPELLDEVDRLTRKRDEAYERALKFCDAEAQRQAKFRDECHEDSEPWQVYNQGVFTAKGIAAAISLAKGSLGKGDEK